jgi:RNA polymerase sigma-70 factor (ECF subfamily)
MPVTTTDEDLMNRYQNGSQEAFSELYERYHKKVYAYCQAKLRDQEKSQDAFQACFLNLHRSRASYVSPLPFAAWLFTICHHAIVDQIRKAPKGEENLQSEMAAPQGPEEIEIKGLDSLGGREASALNWRFQDDLPFEEIGKRLGTSSSNARQLISRAIKKLRKVYGHKE